MSNSLRWDNVTPTVQNNGSMQQAQNQMLQGLHGIENLVKDQERRTDRIISKEKDENSVAALEALLSADVSEVANMDLDQFGRMTAQQKQQLLIAKDARASELLTRAAADQEAINKADNERVKTQTTEFWRTHGDEVEAELRKGNVQGAKAFIEKALPDDGQVVSSVWDKFNTRQVALENHKETIAEHREATAVAERGLANTKQAHGDENISRSAINASYSAGKNYRKETQVLQSDLINEGKKNGVLDDNGNLLPGVSKEALAEYEKMVSERIGGLGSEQLQTLVDEAKRIHNPAEREKTIQQIRQNFMSELELTPEQQKGFIAETEALDNAKTIELTKVENETKKLRKDNWAYDAKYDERTATEKIAKVTEIFKGLGDKASKWEFNNRNELVNLVAHGLDIGGGLPPVRITPEIIEAFVRERGYREDNDLFVTSGNSGVKARTELSNWLNEPQNRQTIVDAEKAFGKHQDKRYETEQQYSAESARIQQRIRSAQGYGGGQDLNVLQQQLRGALNNPEANDVWKNRFTRDRKPDQTQTKQISDAALEMAKELGFKPSSAESLATFEETAEWVIRHRQHDNDAQAKELYYDFTKQAKQVEDIESQINKGLERLSYKRQIVDLEHELWKTSSASPKGIVLSNTLRFLRRQDGERMRERSGVPDSEEEVRLLVGKRDDMMGNLSTLENQLKQLSR